MKLYEEVRSWCEANGKDPEDYGLSPEKWELFVEERRQRFLELRAVVCLHLATILLLKILL